jgi:hypothetical protein
MNDRHLGQVTSAALDSLMSPLHAWRERRFAAALCDELLCSYRVVVEMHPDLARPEVYRQVIAAHTGGDSRSVAATIERAQESFATWPVERSLTLRDVAHYLAVSEFLQTQQGAHWIHANLKHVVDSTIPHGL